MGSTMASIAASLIDNPSPSVPDAGTRRRWMRSESGNAAVEFAITLPVFLVVVLGILVYGLYFGVAHGVQQLAAEAARASVSGLSYAERAAIARSTIDRTIGSYPLLRLIGLDVEGRSDVDDPTRFVVTVRYDASHLGLSAFSRFLPSPPEAIERTAIVRRGGY